MQFQLLAEKALEKDDQYKSLLSKLHSKCLKEAQNPDQISKCLHKRQHFETYLNQYAYQYRQKGRRICNQVLKKASDIDEKRKVKNECVGFYSKSIDIFLGNVRDKLRSLTDNIDFSQL